MRITNRMMTNNMLVILIRISKMYPSLKNNILPERRFRGHQRINCYGSCSEVKDQFDRA